LGCRSFATFNSRSAFASTPYPDGKRDAPRSAVIGARVSAVVGAALPRPATNFASRRAYHLGGVNDRLHLCVGPSVRCDAQSSGLSRQSRDSYSPSFKLTDSFLRYRRPSGPQITRRVRARSGPGSACQSPATNTFSRGSASRTFSTSEMVGGRMRRERPRCLLAFEGVCCPCRQGNDVDGGKPELRLLDGLDRPVAERREDEYLVIGVRVRNRLVIASPDEPANHVAHPGLKTHERRT
jgi:hypothetical protein